jgi:DNA-binding transcriptional ArsR family regulator
METSDAIAALAALAQPTRLAAYRMLIAAEPDGLASGDLARGLRIPANTLSTHASVLARAGLVVGERDSRSVIYRANPGRVAELADFLTRGCCGGHPAKCPRASGPFSDHPIRNDGAPIHE